MKIKKTFLSFCFCIKFLSGVKRSKPEQELCHERRSWSESHLRISNRMSKKTFLKVLWWSSQSEDLDSTDTEHQLLRRTVMRKQGGVIRNFSIRKQFERRTVVLSFAIRETTTQCVFCCVIVTYKCSPWEWVVMLQN